MATIFQNGRSDKTQMSINGWKIWVNHLYRNILSFRSVDWIMLNRNMILKIQYGRHIWHNGLHCLDRHTYVNITIKSTKFTWRKSIILWMNKGCNIWSKESNIVAMLITITVLYIHDNQYWWSYMKDKFVISVISLAVHLYKQDFCN